MNEADGYDEIKSAIKGLESRIVHLRSQEQSAVVELKELRAKLFQLQQGSQSNVKDAKPVASATNRSSPDEKSSLP